MNDPIPFPGSEQIPLLQSHDGVKGTHTPLTETKPGRHAHEQFALTAGYVHDPSSTHAAAK